MDPNRGIPYVVFCDWRCFGCSNNLFFIFKGELPSFEQLENPQYDLASIVYSDNQTEFGKYYIENRQFVDYKDLSPNIVNSLISTEDARYYSHSGVDFIALLRVLFKTVLSGNDSSGRREYYIAATC